MDIILTSVIDKHINLPILRFHLGEGSINRIIVLNVYLNREKLAL